MNKQVKLEKLADDAIDLKDFRELVGKTIKEIKDLSGTMSGLKVWYNSHTHVTTGKTPPPYTITTMKPFVEVQFKSFRIEVFTFNEGLGEIKVVDINGSKTDRIGKRKLRKAKKVLIPATTMWFKSGYKDTMKLDKFLKLTLKR